MNVNELIEVTPQHKPTTMLQSALAALGDCYNSAGKAVHLSPGQAAALLVEDERKGKVIIAFAGRLKELRSSRWTSMAEIKRLEREVSRHAELVIDLAERLSALEPANPYEER